MSSRNRNSGSMLLGIVVAGTIGLILMATLMSTSKVTSGVSRDLEGGAGVAAIHRNIQAALAGGNCVGVFRNDSAGTPRYLGSTAVAANERIVGIYLGTQAVAVEGGVYGGIKVSSLEFTNYVGPQGVGSGTLTYRVGMRVRLVKSGVNGTPVGTKYPEILMTLTAAESTGLVNGCSNNAGGGGGAFLGVVNLRASPASPISVTLPANTAYVDMSGVANFAGGAGGPSQEDTVQYQAFFDIGATSWTGFRAAILGVGDDYTTASFWNAQPFGTAVTLGGDNTMIAPHAAISTAIPIASYNAGTRVLTVSALYFATTVDGVFSFRCFGTP